MADYRGIDVDAPPEDVEDADCAEDDEIDDFIVLVDAEGNETEFQFLAIVEVEGQQYALLTPSEEEEEGEPTEVFIFSSETDEDGDETYSDVADEETFERVKAAAEAFFSSLEDDALDA